MTLEYSLSLNRAVLFEDGESGEETHAAEGDELAGVDGEAHEGEAEDVINPVIPEWSEAYWALGLFALLYLLMRYVLVPPIKAAMDERENKIRDAKDAADRVDSDMGSAQADYDAAVAGARDEANAMVEAARTEAVAYRAELQADADVEIASLKAEAEAEISSARASAMSELRSDVSSLAVSAASTVVGHSIDAGSAQSTIDAILDGGAS